MRYETKNRIAYMTGIAVIFGLVFTMIALLMLDYKGHTRCYERSWEYENVTWDGTVYCVATTNGTRRVVKLPWLP